MQNFSIVDTDSTIQINHSTGRLVGAEALMRFIDPVLGIQYPNDFIPVFEKNGLITLADLHIFECVCQYLKNNKMYHEIVSKLHYLILHQ